MSTVLRGDDEVNVVSCIVMTIVFDDAPCTGTLRSHKTMDVNGFTVILNDVVDALHIHKRVIHYLIAIEGGIMCQQRIKMEVTGDTWIRAVASGLYGIIFLWHPLG